MDVAVDSRAVYDQGFEVTFVAPLEVEAEHLVPKQTVLLTGLKHAETEVPPLDQARAIEGGF